MCIACNPDENQLFQAHPSQVPFIPIGLGSVPLFHVSAPGVSVSENQRRLPGRLLLAGDADPCPLQGTGVASELTTLVPDTTSAAVESGLRLDADSIECLETPVVRVRWFQQSGLAVVTTLARYYNPFFLLIFLWYWALDHVRVAFLERSASIGFCQLISELKAVTSRKARKPLPTVLEPSTALSRNNGAAVVEYARDNREAIVQRIEKSGGVLFRGFDIPDENAASSVLRALRLEPVDYHISDELGDFRPSVNEFFRRDGRVNSSNSRSPSRIRRSAEWLGERLGLSWERPWMGPAHFGYHNEAAYGNCPLGPSRGYLFPDYLVLFCVEPARTGGITVISDCRRVLGRVRAGILKKQTYQGLFDMRAGARAFGPIRLSTNVYKARGELSVERWEGSKCPIALEHPRTGDASFANHLVHDGMFRPHRHFGDGSALKEPDHFHIWKAHVLETTFFSWKKGDLLILDNRLVAHSGTAFNRGAGQKRELRVATANAASGKGEAA